MLALWPNQEVMKVNYSYNWGRSWSVWGVPDSWIPLIYHTSELVVTSYGPTATETTTAENMENGHSYQLLEIGKQMLYLCVILSSSE